MNRTDIIIKGHALMHRHISRYNEILPAYFITKQESLKSEIMDLRSRIRKCISNIEDCLNNDFVAVEFHEQKK